MMVVVVSVSLPVAAVARPIVITSVSLESQHDVIDSAARHRKLLTKARVVEGCKGDLRDRVDSAVSDGIERFQRRKGERRKTSTLRFRFPIRIAAVLVACEPPSASAVAATVSRRRRRRRGRRKMFVFCVARARNVLGERRRREEAASVAVLRVFRVSLLVVLFVAVRGGDAVAAERLGLVLVLQRR